ncbi:carbohydrate kinase [Actinomadura graeca]|uniref:Carbohydrate kinase n=1 Tax=Actinomadura graeca TaxID=2750812 RepID=A0ABX8QXY8_9ACTN|nr:carbohydrate kinase [Actinomadura graeca]QXJ23630.1 carbohydrate kinase [Actinomadura graeca]
MQAKVLVIGESVADAVISDDRSSGDKTVMTVIAGGGPANTAATLSSLGTPTRFGGRLGQGPLGALLYRRLQESNLDLSASVQVQDPVSLAISSLTPDGQPTYGFYTEGTADWLWTQKELAAIPTNDVCCLHTGSLGLAMRPGGPLIEDLAASLRPNVTISIDPNVRPTLVPIDEYQHRIDRWCQLADIIRLSDEDLAHIAPDTPEKTVFERWHSLGVSLIVTTRGKNGASISLNGETATVPGVSVDVVDTVGAGDSFAAGLLHWLWRHDHLGGRLHKLTLDDALKAATLATHVGALACTTTGPSAAHPSDLPPEAHQLLST